MPLDDQVERGVEQRMARTDERRQGLAGNADEVFSKVMRSYRCKNGLAAADLPVAVADDGRNMLDLVALRLPFVDRAAEQLEGFDEERAMKCG